MIKQLRMKSLLLLCALIVGSLGAWGAETATLSISASVTNQGNLTDNKGNTWAFTADGTLTGNNSYIQAGTNKLGVSFIKLVTTAYSTKKITKVQVWGTSKANTNVSAKVIIGSTTIGTSQVYTTQTASDGGTEYSVNNSDDAMGDLTIEISRPSSTTGAIYFNKAIITYEDAEPSSAATFANTTPSIDYPSTTTYSQEPSTADGYTGTIFYEITDNTAGATINSSNGLVTVTHGGSVTVKAVAPSITGFMKSEATYTLTVNDTRSNAELAWSAATKDVTYKELPYELPTLKNPHSLSITYSSSDETVATIDSDGNVTVNNVTGSTTINAEFAGNMEYAYQTVSYTLNVTKGAYEIIDGVFDFVQAGESTPLVDYGSGMTLTTGAYTTEEKTWTAGKVTMVTSVKSGNGIRWWNADHTLRFYNGSQATFSVPSGYAITKIVTTGASFTNADKGTLTDGTLTDDTWTGVENEVTLSVDETKSIKTISVTYTNNFKKSIGADEWATWVAPYNLTVPSGVTAYIATKSTSDNVVLTSVDKIKGGTAVILNGSNAEYTFAVTTESVDYPKTNLLLISDDNVSNGVFVLAKKNGTVGFYKWAGGTLGKGRVYLDAPAAGAREFIGFDFEDEMTTGINEVKIANNNEYFNLGGQRVAQPKKGLYIVNGKKVIIK